MSRETAPHLVHVVEAVRVEELLVEVGVEDLDLVSTIGGVRADLTKPRAGRLPGSSPSTVALTRWSARAALVFSGLRSELIGVATSSS